MIKKVIFITAILFVCLFSLHRNNAQNQPGVLPIQADNESELITPQEIELFDSEGEPIIYSDWMKAVIATSPVNPNDVGDWFGTYQFLPNGSDKIYLAAGLARPAQQAGGAVGMITLRDTDPTQMNVEALPVINRIVNSEVIHYLEEDGVHEMDYVSEDMIIVAGADPAITDSTGGNIYKLDTTSDELTKVRCFTGDNAGNCQDDSYVFPNVIHFFGVTVLGQNVYLAGSTNPTEGGVSDPVVYWSDDSGDTWEETWLYPSGFYRIKDIIGFQDTFEETNRNLLYTNLTDMFGTISNNGVFLSIGDLLDPVGYDWTELYSSGGRAPHTFVKGTTFNDTPIYVKHDGSSLLHFAMEADGSYSINEVSLGSLTIGQTVGSDNYYKHHVLTEIDDYLYIVADDNAIYKSTLETPVNWTKVAEFESEDHIITLRYWEERNALLAGSHGLDAKNFYIPLPNPEPTPTPSPSPIFSSSRVKGITCDYETPREIPHLFAAIRTGNRVELQFSPVRGTTGYYISYGLDTALNQFGTHFTWSDESGVIKYTIYDLDPKKTYSFSVRSQNHCQPGEWSNVLTVKP